MLEILPFMEKATVWEFQGAFEGYSGTIDIAVNSADNSVIFISLVPDFTGFNLGSYIIFENFNTSKPAPDTYGIPTGYCWDPTRTGPPGVSEMEVPELVS